MYMKDHPTSRVPCRCHYHLPLYLVAFHHSGGSAGGVKGSILVSSLSKSINSMRKLIFLKMVFFTDSKAISFCLASDVFSIASFFPSLRWHTSPVTPTPSYITVSALYRVEVLHFMQLSAVQFSRFECHCYKLHRR